MNYLNFGLGYFALLAAILFFATAYAHTTGSLFGLRVERLLPIALSFGATHAIISIASLLVPPTEPVLTALLSLAVVVMTAGFVLRGMKRPNHANFAWLVGNIFAVSGISFEASRHLAEAGVFAVLPLVIIVMTSFIIANTAYKLPMASPGARA